MEILDGKKIRKEILEELKEDLKKVDRPLGLVVIEVGEDEGSKVYVGQKKKIAEELGFVGCAIVILLFGILIWRGILTAIKAPDLFGTLVATGITALIAIQVVINIGEQFY